MSVFDALTLLVVLAALFSFATHRFLRLPATIGVMLMALVISLALIGLERLGLDVAGPAEALLARVAFDQALLVGMLGFLLFAGALHVNLGDLAEQKGIVAILATAGVALSTAITGLATWVVFAALGMPLALIHCLLFGALISPTDPIAVLGIVKRAGAPRSLETKIVGESLFNDGIGVVVFLVLLAIATGGDGHGGGLGAAGVARLFAVEVLGGVLVGLAVGLAGFWLLRQVDSYQVEVLLSLAIVMGGYALAGALHASGPLAVVVAGLLIGNHGRTLAMSETTRRHLDTFWELVDEILNAVLFVMIGLEILILPLDPVPWLAGLAAIPVILIARFVAVGGTVALLRRRRDFSPGVVRILTWAGLRGGISVALALSLPPGPERTALLVATYVVVVFSITVQGLTVGRLVRRHVDAPSGTAPA